MLVAIQQFGQRLSARVAGLFVEELTEAQNLFRDRFICRPAGRSNQID
jgi:hypothetical protein